MTYSDKLKNPKWQKKRLEILNLHGFKCEKCGCEDKELHVHHRFYLKGREVWQYDNDVFQVLCCDCHEKEHSKEKETIEVIPEKYKELIELVDTLNSRNNMNQEYLEYLLKNIIEREELNDETYDLIHLIEVYANRDYGDVLRFYIDDYLQKENTEREMWSTINELKETIKKLRS